MTQPPQQKLLKKKAPIDHSFQLIQSDLFVRLLILSENHLNTLYFRMDGVYYSIWMVISLCGQC